MTFPSNPVQRISLTHGKWAVVDAADYELLMTFPWRAIRIRRTWYAHTYVQGAEEFMHRLIMGAHPGEHIDHRNGDGLDNRRSNLRHTTNALNQANGRRIRSKSGFKGVSWDCTKRKRPWRAHITLNGKFTYLGAFATPEEATRAYDKAAREHFGEHAATNDELGLVSSERN